MNARRSRPPTMIESRRMPASRGRLRSDDLAPRPRAGSRVVIGARNAGAGSSRSPRWRWVYIGPRSLPAPVGPGIAWPFPTRTGCSTWTALAVALVALAFYLRTMLRTDGFWDAAEAQTVPRATLSIFHPTGFPTYAMLGWLWSQIPLGGIAWRMNLLSAVCLALSSGLVVLIAGHLIDERHPGVRAAAAAVAGGVFAFAAESWALAVAADVHALNTLFVALVIWLLFLLAGGGMERGPAPRALAAGRVGGVRDRDGQPPAGGPACLRDRRVAVPRRPRHLAPMAADRRLSRAPGTWPGDVSLHPDPGPYTAAATALLRASHDPGADDYLVFAEQFHGLFDFGNLLTTFGPTGRTRHPSSRANTSARGGCWSPSGQRRCRSGSSARSSSWDWWSSPTSSTR